MEPTKDGDDERGAADGVVKSERPRRRIPVADRDMRGGCTRMIRAPSGLLILFGALQVLAGWAGNPDVFLAGVAQAATGVLGWTLTIARSRGPRAHRLLSERPRVAGWTPRHGVLALVAVVFLLLAPSACIASMSTSPTVAVLIGGAGAALGLAAWRLAQPSNDTNWYRRRKSAKSRSSRPDETWTWDYPWDGRGERRSFLYRLAGRWSFAGAASVCFSSLALPVPGGDLVVTGVRIALGVGACVWAWRVWTVLGMRNVFVGYVRFPFHPGERVVLTIGVSEGGAEITDATLVLRHSRESRGDADVVAGVPLRDFTVEPAEGPSTRTLVPGTDQVVEFDVPAGAPGTSISSAHPSYWELEVRGRTRDGEHTEWFLVPIYARPAGGERSEA